MLDYKELKSAIIKASVSSKKSTNFVVKFDKLSKAVEELGLVMVNTGTQSSNIDPKDIICLSEYFKANKLKWINNSKDYTTLIFIDKDKVDDKCQELLDIMNLSQIDNPSVDKSNTLATILADYPCYLASVVSYISNEPRRFNALSFDIQIRVNTVMIKDPNYVYPSGGKKEK